MDKAVERESLYKEIMAVYEDGKAYTARECAVILHKKGIVHFGIRQEAQPRITELVQYGKLETVGSKFDVVTKKTVTLYKAVV